METPKSWEKVRTICIVKTLAKLGHFPTKIAKKEAWFLSPFRSEAQASFSVSLHKNLWYDFGTGKGGSTIDLIMAMKSCNFKEAVEFLQEDTLISSFSPPKKSKSSESKIQIATVERIKLPALIKYLRSRNIPVEIARKYCLQVWYRYKDSQYFAIGLENYKGGWELRNKYFKNSSSPKTYSMFERGSKNLLVLEGMFDFLSLATIDEDLVQNSDCVILNSLAFLDRIEMLIPKYDEVQLFLDNDSAGKKATKELLILYYNITDKSGFYKPHKDLNEKLNHLD